MKLTMKPGSQAIALDLETGNKLSGDDCNLCSPQVLGTCEEKCDLGTAQHKDALFCYAAMVHAG